VSHNIYSAFGVRSWAFGVPFHCTVAEDVTDPKKRINANASGLAFPQCRTLPVPMSDTAITIESLFKTYPGDVTAVENLSLSIPRGRIFGLIGPNGAGKTTTVRMTCGLVPITAGSILVDGLDVTSSPNDVRRRIGLLPEDAGDYRNLTLEEELVYHGSLFGLTPATVRERSRELIDRLGLGVQRRRRLKTFSRGMRRKFHLIRALLHRPSLLLLDEPTAGLDPAIVEDVWTLLKDLTASHGVTIVLCSHHLEEVERLCDRIAILKRRLLVEGTLAELTASDGRYRLEVVGDAAVWTAVVSGVNGVSEALADGRAITFQVSGEAEAIVPAVVSAVCAAGGRVVSLVRRQVDLRTLYRSFVGNGGEPVATE
jgi:ABC-2 type transport system ATP-binding protein